MTGRDQVSDAIDKLVKDSGCSIAYVMHDKKGYTIIGEVNPLLLLGGISKLQYVAHKIEAEG